MKLISKFIFYILFIGLIALSVAYWSEEVKAYLCSLPNPLERLAYFVLFLVSGAVYVIKRICIPHALYILALCGFCVAGFLGSIGDQPILILALSATLFLMVYGYRMFDTHRQGRKARRVAY